jgi:dihydrofolate reductase
MAPRCSVFIAASLDGFIARTDGSLDWLSIVERPGEDYGYRAFIDDVDALVLGRRTYESVLRFDSWPYAKKRCVVLTHRPPTPRHGEEFFAGSPSELVRRLSLAGTRRIYVDGGDVIRQFLAAGLIDDLTLSTIPVLLGDGVRLFGGTGAEIRFALVASRSFSSGLVQHEYRARR